jgi:hypothetical protein
MKGRKVKDQGTSLPKRLPLRLSRRLFDQCSGKVAELAARTRLAPKTIYKIINASSQLPHEQGPIPARIDTLERLCEELDLDVLEVLQRSKPRLVRSPGKVSIFIGAHRSRGDSEPPWVSPVDLRAVISLSELLQSFFRHPDGAPGRAEAAPGEPELCLVLPQALAESEARYRALGAQGYFRFVVGSGPSNALFVKACEEIVQKFPAEQRPPVSFTRYTSGKRSPARSAVERTVRDHDDVGVEVREGRGKRRHFARDAVSRRTYRDVAVVMATPGVCLVAGHGAAGTLYGARHLLRQHWGEIETHVFEHGVCIVIAQVWAELDQDMCPIPVRGAVPSWYVPDLSARGI